MSNLETTRLKLRRFTPADAPALARLYGDDVVMRYMLSGTGQQSGSGLQRGNALERAKSNILNFNQHWDRRGFGVWAVTDRADGHLLGQCGLRYIPELDATELLYLLNKTVWGRGLASEAAAAAVDFAFAVAHLPALIGIVHPKNLASRRVLEKAGLAFERNAPLLDQELAWYRRVNENAVPDAAIIPAASAGK